MTPAGLWRLAVCAIILTGCGTPDDPAGVAECESIEFPQSIDGWQLRTAPDNDFAFLHPGEWEAAVVGDEEVSFPEHMLQNAGVASEIQSVAQQAPSGLPRFTVFSLSGLTDEVGGVNDELLQQLYSGAGSTSFEICLLGTRAIGANFSQSPVDPDLYQESVFVLLGDAVYHIRWLDTSDDRVEMFHDMLGAFGPATKSKGADPSGP